MSKKNLRYQERTSNIALEHLLIKNNFKLQSPTGSGKTMIIGLIIERILRNPTFYLKKKTFIFVAPSTGSLDKQGYEKISSYLNWDWIKGFETNYIGVSGGKTKKSQYLQNIDKFKENNVYFIGWSLFGKNSNLSKIDSEKNNIHRVIQNTKNSGIEIILIIDEAHREVQTNSDNKKVILDFMKPFKTIEVSATQDDPDYKVTLQDVRDEMAIKKNVIVDKGIPEQGEVDNPGEINDLIVAALKKQTEIKANYLRNKINDNPLILIQIPDKSSTKIKHLNLKINDYYREQVEKILKKKGLKEGFNYAVWLSEYKTTNNKKEITWLNSNYDVLVFKQAIATGWDIPRANILIRLREPISPKFDIQTLGRVLRNPRFKYYDSGLIDNAFVFTRDEKYFEKIKKEEFVEVSEKICVPLSESGKKSTMEINKIFYSKHTQDVKIINYIYKTLFNKQKIIIDHINAIENDFFEVKSPIILDSSKIQEGKTLEEIEISKNCNKHSGAFQISDKLISGYDDNLFIIYIKYISSFNNKNLNFEAMDKFINYLSTSKNIKKKEVYKKLISQDAIDKTNNLLNNLNIFEYLNLIKNEAIKKLTFLEIEKYKLHSEFNYSKDKVDSKTWDKINTYNLSIKSTLDSKVEENFYREITNFLRSVNVILDFKNKKQIHLFRNGVDSKSYYIEYFANDDKLAKFYPDFILIDDYLKKVSIFETKGRRAINEDIDPQSKLKFHYSWLKEEKIKIDYPVKIYRAEPTPSNNKINLFDKNDNVETLSNFMEKRISKITDSLKNNSR